MSILDSLEKLLDASHEAKAKIFKAADTVTGVTQEIIDLADNIHNDVVKLAQVASIAIPKEENTNEDNKGTDSKE